MNPQGDRAASAYLIADVQPFVATPLTVGVVHAYIVMQLAGTLILGRGQISIFWDEMYAMIRSLTYAIGNLSFFTRRSLAFAVTPKGDDADADAKADPPKLPSKAPEPPRPADEDEPSSTSTSTIGE